MTKPTLTDLETVLDASIMQPLVDTVHDALGAEVTPEGALAFLGGAPAATTYSATEVDEALATRGPVLATAQALRDLDLTGSPTSAITVDAVLLDDGGGGTWWWDTTSEAEDDLATVLCPTGRVIPGRWRRVIQGDTVYVEWWGLPDLAAGENEAGHWTDAGLFAWRNGYPLVTLRKPRDGMRLWGLILCSRVRYALKGSRIKPYVPVAPEGGDTEHPLTIFAHGADVRVPQEFVTRYGLRTAEDVNAMLNDTDYRIDHRYQHPDAPVDPNPDIVFIQFKEGEGPWDPHGRVVQTEGTATFAPGQMVILYRPYSETTTDVAAARFNVVESVSGEYVYFRHELEFPFAYECLDGDPLAQTVRGGISAVPDNWALVDCHVEDFELDCSDVPTATHITQVWRANPAWGCSCKNFRVYGGEYWWGLWPKGRFNYIGGLRGNGERSSIVGGGSFIANEQFNSNTFEYLDVVLTSWARAYPGSGYVNLTGHLGERSTARLRHMSFRAPPYDADTGVASGTPLTDGSINNELVDVEVLNGIGSILNLEQVEGWGQLIARDVRYRGNLQGNLITIGKADTLGSGMGSNELAIVADDIDFRVTQRPAALSTLTALSPLEAFATTDANLSRVSVEMVDGDTGDPLLWPANTAMWRMSYPGTPSDVLSRDNLLSLSSRFQASGVGLPELRWRRFGVSQIETVATKDLANDRITLPTAANTYFGFSLAEEDQQCAALYYVLYLIDISGVGGTVEVQGTLFAATTADPDAPAARSSSPGSTTLTLAATTDEQVFVLPVVRNTTDGYLPIGSVQLQRRGFLDTAPTVYLRRVDCLIAGGR